jgi:hypothetical protein
LRDQFSSVLLSSPQVRGQFSSGQSSVLLRSEFSSPQVRGQFSSRRTDGTTRSITGVMPDLWGFFRFLKAAAQAHAAARNTNAEAEAKAAAETAAAGAGNTKGSEHTAPEDGFRIMDFEKKETKKVQRSAPPGGGGGGHALRGGSGITHIYWCQCKTMEARTRKCQFS